MQIHFADLPYRIQVLLMQEHAERLLRADKMFTDMEYYFGEQHDVSGVRVSLRPRPSKRSR